MERLSVAGPSDTDLDADLDEVLRQLKIMYFEKGNPIYVWDAIHTIIVRAWTRGRLDGPFAFPNWIIRYLTMAADDIHSLTTKKRPPSNAEAAPAVLRTLGFSTEGTRSIFREYAQNESQLMLALMAEKCNFNDLFCEALADDKEMAHHFASLRPRAGKDDPTDPRPIKRLMVKGRKRLKRIRTARDHATT